MLFVLEEIASSSTWSLQWTCTTLGLDSTRQKSNMSISEDAPIPHTHTHTHTHKIIHVLGYMLASMKAVTTLRCQSVFVTSFMSLVRFCIYDAHFMLCVANCGCHPVSRIAHLIRSAYDVSRGLYSDLWHTKQNNNKKTSESFEIILNGNNGRKLILYLI